MTFVRWATMWHAVFVRKYRGAVAQTWCGRSVPADAERTKEPERTLLCAVCAAAVEETR